MKTANIISMAVQVGTDGNFYIEYSELPFEKIDDVFRNKFEASLVKSIHKFMDHKFKDAAISLSKEIKTVTSTIR